jgi:hypothetical protein
MAQHDYIISNQSGAAFRADLNNGLAAIVSQNSGTNQPSTTYAYQWWADTTTGLLKIRNAANNAWITIGTLADVNLGLISTGGGTLTGALLLDDGGTAALPAAAFDNDPDTGIFRKAANELGFSSAGALVTWLAANGFNIAAQGDLRLWDSDSSNYVGLQAPTTVGTNLTWTLPAADGTNGQKLSTNGSGELSWTASVPGITYLTSGTSATYTPTSGTKAIYVEVVGAGGGGGGVDGQGAGTGAAGGAGGGGGYAATLITDMNQTFTYTIGAGGSGGAAGNNAGIAGGTSTFIASVSGTLTATSGTGGAGDSGSAGLTRAAGGGPGTGSGGTLNLSGRTGTTGVANGVLVLSVSIAGASFFGGGSGNGIGNTAGATGSNFGTGATGAVSSSSATDFAGGTGAAGVIRITEYF